jgi:hypothetical protein
MFSCSDREGLIFWGKSLIVIWHIDMVIEVKNNG